MENVFGHFKVKVFAATLAMAIMAVGAFAQLTVGKDGTAMYATIQAAVNAAKPGETIQILDTEVYAEQVTIDGRETSPWTGVTGGKNGITIRYAPPAGTAPNSNFARPTIRYRDISNTSPKTAAEASRDGELPGSSGNFETNGALRIIRASGVTIDGVAVDGVSAYPFWAAGVWCESGGLRCSPLFHGNAAITLAIANGVVIRNCDLKNAYFGIYIKDRNTGGVFGNPNPSDNDVTIPLSGFGKTGNHLFEYNRVHNNSVGFFFESAWDLGSTVRYNLIYSNKHTTATSAAITIEKDNQMDGAFLFKDMYITPVAIYNNTLYDNAHNLLGNWQMGGQHLIFNNIFSKSATANASASYMVIDGMFPNRMHNSVFSAKTVQGSIRNDYNCADNAAIAPGGYFVQNVQFEGFANPTQTLVSLTLCNTNYTERAYAILPGALIPGPMGLNLPNLPATANVRWLQTEGGTYSGGLSTTASLPVLFKSVNPDHPDFLVPDWDNAQVIEFIKNKGWADIGIRNSGGDIADLGAIPSTGKAQSTVARIKPTNVVLVSGTQATADMFLTVESGVMTGPKIKFLRWINPIPDNTDKWANDWTVVPATSIRTIANTSAVSAGKSQFTFTLPAALAAANKYGFFEIVVEGTDASGNTVSSDVGFLPYRQLEYELVIEVFPPTGPMTDATKLTEVVAGDPVRVRVTPRKIGEAGAFTSVLKEIDFQLMSDPAASMKYTATNQPLTTYKPVAGETVMTFPVYFEKEGDETIRGAGIYESGASRMAFLGNCDIRVTRTVKLVYSAGANGDILGPVSQSVLPGASGMAVVAVPDPGYSFVMWSDGLATAERRDVSVTSNISVTAVFAAEGARVVLYAAGEGGSISGSAIQEVASGGTGTTVLAVPNTGYIFVSWSDGLTSASRTDANIKSNVMYTAKFAKIYRLSYSAGANGEVFGVLDQEVGAGNSGTKVMAVADPGYKFESWSDGVTAADRTDVKVRADITVTAIFGEHKYILSYKASSEYGVILISGDYFQELTERVNPGANGPRIVAVGNDGYTFHSWSDGKTTALRQDLDVQSDITVQAYFVDENGNISVASNERVIPNGKPETAVVAPVNQLTAEFTAGPNPVNKSSGAVNFFRRGVGIKDGTLVIYDVTGNFVRKVGVSDKSVGNSGRRKVGSWDLTDGKGRHVSPGTYLFRGTVTGLDGRKETVSLILKVN